MHQVYDDETTFKLVAAASNVSGLPVEVCLEEFGKHFLVYCQKNGYDQILRVLGSNLYDFLTNLDNLHDHLASIYPGMRAPSFRVTKQLDSCLLGLAPRRRGARDAGDSGASDAEEEAKQSAQGSMYLHYYSERKGLSPIVKGLVMAVAKEFFSTDISVTECPQGKDDHVVLKIDRRSQAQISLGKEASEAIELAAEEAAAVQLRKERSNEERHSKQKAAMLSAAYGDLLSKNASDSLVNSEIMMQAFPFHVIFDRQFNLVQVGKSLLSATSMFWKRVARERSSQHEERPVKFSDLFSIVRPKIEFTFDAIADHTNQVFVVRTKRHVLNSDFLRAASQATTSGPQSALMEAPTAALRSQRSHSIAPTMQHQLQAPPSTTSGPRCPFDKIARERRMTSAAPAIHGTRVNLRSSAALKRELSQDDSGEGEGGGETANGETPKPEVGASGGHQDDAAGELVTHLSLRLKGQMIVLNCDGQETEEDCYCLFLCSPRVDHLDQLQECGVSMSDFALHDRARELMLMSHTHKEDREAVKKLDQASNDLKKMDTKLRQENKRTNEVLHNIFPAKIAALLSHGHRVESESHELVSCLYSDIIGFTKMCGSENVRPIDIVRLLNTLYLQFDNLTNIHGVYKVETIGDAYVVVGGLPEPVEDHADRCVRMGLDMVKVIATVRSPADNQPIQVSYNHTPLPLSLQ